VSTLKHAIHPKTVREGMAFTILVAYATVGLGQAASLLYFFLLFRSLSIEDAGVYSWAIAVASIYSYVMDLGLAPFLVGELSTHSYGLRHVMAVTSILRFPVLALSWLLLKAWTWAAAPSDLESLVLGFIVVSYSLQMFDLGIVSWLQVRQRQNAANVLTMSVSLVRLAGVLLPIWLGYPVTLWYIVRLAIVAQVFSTTSFIVLAACHARGVEPHSSPLGTLHMLGRFWQRGPRLTVTYLLIALQNRLDWLLVAGILSKAALANYSIANKLLEFPMLLAGTAARTTFPWLSRPEASEDHARSRLELWRRIFTFCSGLFCGSLVFWLPTVVRAFVGSKYAGAETAIELMILGGSVFMLNQYLFYSLLAQELEHDYAWLLLVATVLQIVVDLVAMPRLGVLGAVLGMLVMGTILHAGQIGLLIRRHVMERIEVVRTEVFLWSSIAFAAFLWTVSDYLIPNTLIFWLVAGTLGNLLLLRRDGRAQLLNCAYQTRAALYSYSTRLSRSGADGC
jgi:O-antigen/teichoic acid export membrane protein